MSDFSVGPGWWVASDGLWYPPERHPDEAYRRHWGVEPVAAVAADHGSWTGGATPGGLVASASPGEVALGHRPPAAQYPDRPPVEMGAEPPTIWPPAPPAAPGPARQGSRDVVIAGLVVGAGLVLVLATFLTWVRIGEPVDVSQQGWDRDDGPITLVAGIAVAGVGGLVAARVRHLFVKLAILLGGLTALAVFAIDALDVANDADEFAQIDISMGAGLWLVGVAGLVLVVLALLEGSPWGLGGDR